MQLDNTLYAGVQIAHNFGATAVVGLPLAALIFGATEPTLRKIYWLALLAWLVQSASGVGFGMVSYFVVGELPEIHDLALGALCVKILCALLSVILLASKLRKFAWAGSDGVALKSLVGFGSVALLCAAILRWFS
jgi:hypothetical protein